MAALHQALSTSSGRYTIHHGRKVYRSFSTSSGFGGAFAGGFQFSPNAKDLLLDGSEKLTLQNLNERLASYLDKVRSLEKANSKLEVKIREWGEKSAPAAGRDYSTYYRVIEELRAKLQEATFENTKIVLQMDNIKLAAEDFTLKYKSEAAMRLAVENDIQKLRHLRDNLTVTKTNLESEFEVLLEEKIYLEKNHKEEVTQLRRNVNNTVNVEVDAVPGPNLGMLLANMRLQYEELAKKQQQEAKEWFERQTEALNVQVTVSTEELKTRKTEITTLTQTIRDLEITFQTELNQKAAVASTLSEVKAWYSSQLEEVQDRIRVLEEQLLYMRTQAQQQKEKHTALAQEIEMYRRLLEAEEFQSDALEIEENRSRKIKTVVEEIVDGKVVSSQSKEVVQKL
ncbi:keratin, type I cytoskeletal 20-like [Rhinatrema bivittatum]|uniref:keratin, type I cytoskeletal 20-like n=1 Tax=Rhinatrema bivittatum TaxID=194408 RepID=UPI0011260BCD|nr:keratin, type I cytoskeletal 20-like [Rhinatrema bivittatum]